jgi:4-hydroxybenzoate polyprenyltransferase
MMLEFEAFEFRQKCQVARIGALVYVLVYPVMKRFSDWPQLVIGKFSGPPLPSEEGTI